MAAEKGVCPTTGKYCRVRVKCEIAREEDERLLEIGRNVLGSVNNPGAMKFISRFVQGRDILTDAAEEHRRIEVEVGSLEGYLALHCTGRQCTMQDAMERDNFELEMTGEGVGR